MLDSLENNKLNLTAENCPAFGSLSAECLRLLSQAPMNISGWKRIIEIEGDDSPAVEIPIKTPAPNL